MIEEPGLQLCKKALVNTRTALHVSQRLEENGCGVVVARRSEARLRFLDQRKTCAIPLQKNFCVVLPAASFNVWREHGNKETPMYPVALYGSLPEIAYLAPRGNFMPYPPAEEDRPPHRPVEPRPSNAVAKVGAEPFRACDE